MSSREAPLLARRPSFEQSPDRGLAEEEELLTGRQKKTQEQSKWRTWLQFGVLTWAILATMLVVALGVLLEQSRRGRPATGAKPTGKRNLIFMVSDGMGPTSLSLTRSFRQYDMGLPWDDALVLDAHVIGQSRTRSTSSLVTDSAAGATAFSCGQKSYNGAISVLPDDSPCGTVLEAAKAAGYMTGLVVTTRLTDATPACFAAHAHMRSEEDLIAEHMLGYYPLGRNVDLMLGGGRCHFLPNTTTGSCRNDGVDLVKKAENDGWSYISSRQQFDDLNKGSSAKLPLLGLFADTDIPYEIDRRTQTDTYPSLDEMARTALKALSDATRDTEQGFFLMIEGSRIDHAGHANDPAAQVHEVLAYDTAFQSVLDFLAAEPTPGIAVSTSDHETGGLATARQLRPYEYPEYLWHPSVLANASHSAEWLARDYAAHLRSSLSEPHAADASKDDTPAYLRRAVEQHLGIHDATAEELHELASMPRRAAYLFADMLSRRAQTGWSTHGHSAVDVNIYASARDAAPGIAGNVENTDVGRFLAEYLDVDTAAVTERLRAELHGTSWMGGRPESGERLDGQSHEVEFDHYDGEVGRHVRCEVCGV